MTSEYCHVLQRKATCSLIELDRCKKARQIVHKRRACKTTNNTDPAKSCWAICSNKPVVAEETCKCTRRRLLTSAAWLWVASGQCSAAVGSSGQTTRDIYDKASGDYDSLDGGPVANILGLTNLRRRLLAEAHGSVLEVAVGTGLNLPLYNQAAISQFTGLDLSSGMLKQAAARADALNLGAKVSLSEGDVESLPYRDHMFDTVVSTYSMCVFQRPEAALREMARVLKPGGKMLLLEHSRSNFGPLAAYQDLTAEAVAASSKGCAWNQDISRLLEQAGLKAEKLEPHLGGLVTLAEIQTSPELL